MGRFLVVGGGLGGSLLAVFLARRGHTVDVYERHADARADTGKKRPALNLTLCERGLRALGEVGVRERVEALTVPAYGRRIHATDGQTAYQPYGTHREAIYSISRADLNDALVDHAEREPNVRFHFGQKCLNLDLGRALARFEDVRTGAVTEVQADRIFGADGAYSTVRGHLQRVERFNYSQQYLRDGYKSLKIPARPDGSPAMELETLHIWPRGTRMLIGFPNLDHSISCSLLLPFEGEDSYASLTSERALLEFFHAQFPDAVAIIPDLVQQFFATPANSLLTVRCEPWSYQDKVCLVGDAAHAILPSYGQGANAAFEDCSVLGRCMDEHGSDWHAVFRDFEARRRPSMNFMADLCVQHFVELCDLVGDPDFLRRSEIERRLADVYPDLYQTMYSMVSFGTMPYVEAQRVDRRQRSLVDRIMTIAGVEDALESVQVREILERSMREEIRGG